MVALPALVCILPRLRPAALAAPETPDSGHLPCRPAKFPGPPGGAQLADRLVRPRRPDRLKSPGKIVVCQVGAVAAPDRQIVVFIPPGSGKHVTTERAVRNSGWIERKRKRQQQGLGDRVGALLSRAGFTGQQLEGLLVVDRDYAGSGF
jgi:hypothetical protein